MRLSCGNSAFPLLSVEQSIRLAGLLEFDGFDVVLNGNSVALRPETVSRNFSSWTANVRGLLDENGLAASDVFCVPWSDFTTMAPNNPEATERARGRQIFREMLDLASAVGAPGVTMLPGVDWPNESHEESLARAADELQVRAEEADERGLGFSIEAHVGSVCHNPADDDFITIEYIWVAWKRLNEVDVVSETVMLRDRLKANFRGEQWSYPGPTGITEG